MPDFPLNGSTVLDVMIVDDERFARQRLRSLLEEIEGIRVVAEASTLAEAREIFATTSPHLLFLDIELAPGSGFELLPQVPPTAAVVFVTAHTDFAVQAFEDNALDYLLKPVRGERLLRAIGKCRRQFGAESTSRESGGYVLLGDRSNWRRVPVSRIGLILAEDVYTRVFIQDGTSVLMLRPLKEWARLLRDSGFVRLDRSILVNLQAVAQIRIQSRDRAEVEVQGYAEPIHLGRAAIRRARAHLGEMWQGNDPGPSAPRQ